VACKLWCHLLRPVPNSVTTMSLCLCGTWRHPQNRKYMTLVTTPLSEEDRGNLCRKFREIWQCGFWDMQYVHGKNKFLKVLKHWTYTKFFRLTRVWRRAAPCPLWVRHRTELTLRGGGRRLSKNDGHAAVVLHWGKCGCVLSAAQRGLRTGARRGDISERLGRPRPDPRLLH